VRNIRQALASPHSGGFFTIRRDLLTFRSDLQLPALLGWTLEGGRRELQMTKASRLVLALVGAFLISGCALRTVHVAQLKDQPARYYNKTVTVQGTVTRSWGLPLVPFQFYNVDDGTGQITVIGHQGRVPPTGSRVDVKGRVQEVAAFGGQSLGLHLDETKRKIKY
jgi:hypothetical protein